MQQDSITFEIELSHNSPAVILPKSITLFDPRRKPQNNTVIDKNY